MIYDGPALGSSLFLPEPGGPRELKGFLEELGFRVLWF